MARGVGEGVEMSQTWAERFVDDQVERAWLKFRMELADRFAAAQTDGGEEPVDFTSPKGVSMTAGIEDDHVVVRLGNHVHATVNVDEAAHHVVEIIRDRWEVLHPVFLDCPLVDLPPVPDAEPEAVVPSLGRAESREQLQGWVESTLRAWRKGDIKVNPDGSMPWRTRGGNRVLVEVRNEGRIELVTVLARRVGFTKAHKVIDKLSRQWFGLKFFLVQDTLMMSQTVIAHPYAADQLTSALRTFMHNTDQLGWVAEKVESKRAKVDRTAIQALKKAHEEAQEALLAAAEELEVRADRIAAAGRTIEETEQVLEETQADLAAALRERDQARAELAKLRRTLELALGHRAFRAHDGRGAVA